nr:TetR/AcrR family transcriptional regulator [Nocardia brasiliensis]
MLTAATEYVLDHGVADLSLRPLATALGVSHGTLIRHFQTKEALIAEVLGCIRADFETRLLSVELSGDASGIEVLRGIWRRLCQPREMRQFRVLFELAAAVGYSDTRDTTLPETLITNWITLIAQPLIRFGCPPEIAPELATFVLAQIRGLQIDLMTTGDRDRADGAFELMLALIEHARVDLI